MEPTTSHTVEISEAGAVVLLRRRQLRVDVKRGPDARLRRELQLDRIVVGTHPSCDVVLTDPTVSRQHCEIVLVDEGYRIVDLDSTNGTFVDRLRLGRVTTPRSIAIRVGETTIQITPRAETVDLPLSPETSFGALLGRSVAMRRIFDTLRRVAPTDATVLITGESGTGKEVAARSIHDASPRRAGPFVVVDCGALPATLIESELFGHERGAFTGAIATRIGAFEAAGGGTLFLDELGELPVELQSRLLGAIERRTVQRIGGARTIPVDVRMIAATNRDLRREVNRGTFREDLYFRLAVVSVEMPPLRDRPEDVPLYVEDFLAEVSASRPDFSIDPQTLERLARQPWRGNVRELRNMLERATALGEVDLPTGPAATGSGAGVGAEPTLPVLGREVDVCLPFKVGKAALVEEFERSYVAALMRRHGNNISQAARSAEIDRVYLLRILDKYGLRPTR